MALVFPAHPYEIHITVKTGDVEKFKTDCNGLGINPLFIRNQRKNRFWGDLLTNQEVIGQYPEAVAAMGITRNGLEGLGYEIVRQKIETTLENTQFAPQTRTENLRDFSMMYYEAHFKMAMPLGTPSLNEFLEGKDARISTMYGLHLSTNMFSDSKKTSSFIFTYRRNRVQVNSANDFSSYVESIRRDLKRGYGLTVREVSREVCVIDSNEGHDAEWMHGKD